MTSQPQIAPVIFWPDDNPESALETQIREAAIQIMEVLGVGYSEAVYHQALEVELRLRGLKYESKPPLPVLYKGHAVARLEPDLVVEKEMVVELKAYGSRFNGRNQLERYLRHGAYKQGLLVNFSTKPVQFISMTL